MPVCKICFKDIKNDSLNSLFKPSLTCYSCFKKMNPILKNFKIDNVNSLSIYEYNEELKTLIFQYKGCGDYELKDVFISPFVEYFNKRYKNFYMIQVPSSKEKEEERGFCHVKEMFALLNLKRIDCIEKINNEKQSSKNYVERLKVGTCYKIKNKEQINGKNILLVDDICTTGSTLKAIKNLILGGKPKKIEILVIAKRIFSKEELKKIEDPSFILE